MYNLSVNSTKYVELSSQDTIIGDIMMVANSAFGYTDDVILHTFDGFVSLSRPSITWDKGFIMPVRLMPKGTIITIIIE